MSYEPTEAEKQELLAGACALDSHLLTSVLNICAINQLLNLAVRDIMLQYPVRASGVLAEIEGRLTILKEQLAQIPNMEPAALPTPKTIGQTGDIEPRRFAESETSDAP